MIECDDPTAELHMAMAEMMGEDEKQADSEPRPDDQLNVMQFNTVQDNTYGNQDKLYNYSINDFSYYLSSFYGNESSEKTFTDVASNVMQVMGTNPTWEQKIESEIVKIFKNNPQTGTMEHQQLIKYLKEENWGLLIWTMWTY